MRGSTSATTIECFLWTEGEGKESKLIYYDDQGVSHEKEVTRTALDNALRFFSNRVRSVRRSSGGLVLAEPVQIVLYQEANSETSVRIKVKFKDIGRDNRKGGALTCLTHTKVVAPEELLEPFSFEFEGDRAQAFALDFGKGIVPIRIFGYEESQGTSYAYFLEPKETEPLLATSRNQPCLVQPYRAEQSALRWIGPAARTNPEMEKARRNYETMVRAGLKVIPGELAACPALEVPPAPTSEDIWHFLRVLVQRKVSGTSEPVFITVPKDEAEILLPFGIFE
jgi:hypothetical protein